MPTALVAPLRHCPRCVADHPTGDCRTVAVTGGALVLCPACGMVTRAVVRRERRALWTELTQAALWPAKGDNVFAWAALGVGVTLFSKLPSVGWLLASAALCSYLFVVVERGARGEQRAPDAADFQGWWDLALPLMQCAAAMVMPLAPLIGAAFARGTLQWALGLFGVLWLLALGPAALMSTAFGGTLSRALNPVPVFALVGRVPSDYARTVAMLAMLVVAWSLAAAVGMGAVHLARIALSPLVALPLGWAVEAALLYFPLAMARVVAVLLRERADELGIEAFPDLLPR